jgi:hypothetical protein
MKTQTTGKEVLNITSPIFHKWHVPGTEKGDEYSCVVLGGPYDGIIARTQIDVYTDIDKAEGNAKAICTAVNETYGKGFRPEAMEELYNALTKCAKQLERYTSLDYWDTDDDEAYELSKTALNNAKI